MRVKWDEKKMITNTQEAVNAIKKMLPSGIRVIKRGSHFDLIFPLDNSNILKASISGLFFNSTVYSNFYSKFKEKGIYILSLE